MLAGKARYISNLKEGQILAFRSGESVISGKVHEIKEDMLTIQTKNGTNYIIRNSDIVWVKTGQRWPKGVFRALKGEIEDEQQSD